MSTVPEELLHNSKGKNSLREKNTEKRYRIEKKLEKQKGQEEEQKNDSFVYQFCDANIK